MVARSLLAVVVLLFVSLPVLAGTPAEEVAVQPGDGPGVNVMVTISVSKLEEGRRTSVRSYRLVAVAGGRPTELFTGSRVPIPATTFQAATQGAEVVPYTSYVYQNVGFSAEVRARVLPDGRIQLDAEIEDSALDSSVGRERPAVTSWTQKLGAIVADGEPMEIIRLEEGRGHPTVLEIRADVVK